MKKDIFGDVVCEVFKMGGKIELASKKDKSSGEPLFLMFIKIPVPFSKRKRVIDTIRKKRTLKNPLSQGRIFFEENKLTGIILIQKPIFYKGISGGFLKKIKRILEE